MIILNKHNGYSRDGRREYHFGGGGGPTSSTTNTSNIPDWLRPQVESVLGGSMQELFETNKVPGVDGGPATYDITGVKKDAFKPYSANPQDYVAGFSPLQQQVQYNAANLQMPGQYNQATGMTGIAGMGSLGAAQQGMGAGANYANQVTNPNAVQQYMNPYQQNVIDIQNQAAQRQADIARTQRNAQATKAGAFGGSRQAIENAEADRSLQGLMNNNQLQGQQQAYQSAIQNM